MNYKDICSYFIFVFMKECIVSLLCVYIIEGLKANVSEAEHPLLCESTRRQRGELAMSMLVQYKDDQVKLSKVRVILRHVISHNLPLNTEVMYLTFQGF